MKKKKVTLQIIGICLMMLFLCEGCKGQQIQMTEEISEEPSSQKEEESHQQICVYVCGAVVSPGVYELKEGSRICDGISVAGGLSEGAYIDRINQAELLSDGQMLRIPTIKEVEQEALEAEKNGLVNINQASCEELMTLPGIGQSKAEAIISYREEHGAFQSTEEIMNISGIKEKAYEKVKDSITVD